MSRTPRLLALTLAWSLAGTITIAHAHPDEQHGGDEGHLDPVQRNVEVVGALDLFEDEESPGRISDVAVWGDHAYLGAFRHPDCEEGGVYVVDISEPAAPEEVGFIPASPFAYVGEGVQVLDMATDAFTGQVLIHNNENCTPVEGALPAGQGGVSLWDVTEPEEPELLADHAGDQDLAFSGTLPHLSLPHQSHSAFGWQQGENAYLVMVDNGELGSTDIDILDITDPRNPELIVETGMADFVDEDGENLITEDPAPNGANAFIHDMIVKQVGERFLMLVSYWDGGYLILDVTDLPEKPVLLRDTDFGPSEPFHAEMGLPADWTPEGNAHQAEFNFDDTLFLAADEDFGPHRIAGVIADGDFQGDTFSATQGSDTPGVDPENPIQGETVFVGDGCAPIVPLAEPGQIALIERGTCTFNVKASNAEAAGFDAGIVFNDAASDAPQCDAHVNMLAVGTIPFMFTGRSAGLKLLGVDPEGDPCAKATPARATAPRTPIELAAIFDGWGYLHLYDAETMEALDHWALPESLDETKAVGFGDLSIHEVATHPSENLAFVSHYAGGFRVFEFSADTGIQEVGAFIDEGGNNLWGVEVWEHEGEVLALASDRDSGLYIFRYVPEDGGGGTETPACRDRGADRGRDGARGKPEPCIPRWVP